jgi:hypothetical protein
MSKILSHYPDRRWKKMSQAGTLKVEKHDVEMLAAVNEMSRAVFPARKF